MKKILVANRGEIACRVIRSLKKMAIQSVAIYSEADKEALHVREADEAYCIGPAPSNQSYLLGEKIIKLALETGCDGIHPGYGFLSENGAFASMVTAAGIKFIGPSPEAIKIMGSKLAAKDAVKQFDIPLVPGTDTPIEDVDEAEKIAAEIGFPILIKASAGGGGKGMRIVESSEKFRESLELARSEALNAFGDGAVFIEKYVTKPRHIEVQVLADEHGHVVHLYERECSVQRRHQKVVEEAPSVILSPEKRREMGEAAIQVARSCSYVGAGTVEFLMDDDMNFYFLEMNTRLQVEHPVTELITGIDLVEQQIRVARGEKLSFSQEDLSIQGHAIEVRVYAEDPFDGFSPSIDKLSRYVLPEGEGIRVDNAMEEGMEIPIYYDPMISKLITYGESREMAINLMKNAIASYQIEGIAHTLPFGRFVMDDPHFNSGDFDTHFIKKYWSPEAYAERYEKEASVAEALSRILYTESVEELKLTK